MGLTSVNKAKGSAHLKPLFAAGNDRSQFTEKFDKI